MDRKLYKSLVEGISQSLKESLFDDETDELLNNDNNYDNVSLMDDELRELILNSLCTIDDYHIVKSDEDDGLPMIKQDPESTLRYYIAPYRTYKTEGLGPRKRKRYTLNYFYRYILTFDDNGGMTLDITKFGDKPNLIINLPLYKFICKTPYTINEIKHHYPYNEYKEYIDCQWENIYIFEGTPYGKQKHIPNSFVKNFPEIISPSFSDEFKDDMNPSTKPVICRNWFKSDEMFLLFIKKLVNNNACIADENLFIYNQNTIEEREKDILSGDYDKQIANENDEKSNFSRDVLGEKYYQKFQQIQQYFQQNNIKFYLKTINTLRTCKICLKDTIINLRKENNFIYKDIDDVQTLPNRAEPFFERQLLYKMFYIMKTQNLNDWKIDQTYADCVQGVARSFNFYTTSTTYYDINSLPIKFDSDDAIYKLYYVIGKAIADSKSIYDIGLKEFEKYYYKDDITLGPTEVLRQKDIEKANNPSFDIHNFDYTYLTNQLKTIIDKTFKKYKLK